MRGIVSAAVLGCASAHLEPDPTTLGGYPGEMVSFVGIYGPEQEGD